jgi:pimeloyl-ACP methyl ester carboxylesterase
MPFLNLPFHRVHYEDNQVAGPVLIFCHSYGMRAEMFAPQLAAFGATHRCITWDQRAHGASPAQHAFTFWDSAKDLLALMNHLGLETASVVGTSQGGFVALRAALLAPERIQAVGVFGSSVDEEAEAAKAAYRPVGEAFLAGSIWNPPTQAIAAMGEVCFGPDFDGGPWKRSWESWSPDQFLLAFNALAGRDSIFDKLGAIRCPTLVMHGDKDAAYPVETGRRIASGIPGAEFVLVENGHHFLSITNPDQVNSALRGLLSRVQ